MENEKSKKRSAWTNWLLFIITVIVVFIIGLFASSIIERRSEGQLYFQNVNKINDMEPRNEIWGLNYPREFDTYKETSDTSFMSKHNGNAVRDMLEENPRLVVLFAGYGFSKDYKQGRGHSYAITDTRNSLRTGAPKNADDGPMPSTCWTCKSPDVPRMMKQMGVENFYNGKWAALGPEIVNSIGCADCHEVGTMNLTITRPALIEAFQRQGRDIIKNKPSRQEMRSLVCAQCHVEYYFKGDGKYLTFPWDKGMSVESMEKYYDEYEFSDWTHSLSQAPMIKAQHPDYETYKDGIHAKRGVACADCHMPYMSLGGVKFTNHQIVSPLKYVELTCQVCHREDKGKLIESVYENQDKIIENRNKLEELLVKAHIEAKAAWDNKANPEQMKPILKDIRQAQWRWDYAAAAHGASFHAPVEISRIIASGIDKTQEARIKLARLLIKLGQTAEVSYPDISTKEKAQKFIGLNPEKMNSEKEEFLKTMVPEWIKIANSREKKYNSL